MNFGTTLLTKVQTLFGFPQFHWCPFSVPESNPGSLIICSCHVSIVSSNLWQFLSLSLSFVTWTLLECFIDCKLFWRISLNLGVSIFSRLDWEWIYPCVRACVLSIRATWCHCKHTGDVDLGCLVKRYLSEFSTETIFPSVMTKYSETTQTFCFCSNLHSLILVFLQQLQLVF